ncbi:disease resistance protein RGA2-like [Phragmites australis]|uniref:disease resistance protein RGA2-like n=1 Tax=Phragmites australis TaxID=29695 RepID=UPI002D7A404C|nr:disease resistance protein RGA2-like [Phragmites australis]
MEAAAALVFAGKSVATPAIGFIVTKAVKYLTELHAAEGMEESKNNILARIGNIQAVYDAVDRQQITKQREKLDPWLWRLRDAVEEAEDALDEIEYYNIKGGKSKLLGFVSNYVLEKFIAKFTKHGTLERLRKAVYNLDEVSADVGTSLQLVGLSSCPPLQDHAESNGHQTSSVLASTEIFGRDNEKNQIMEWLTKDLDEYPNSVNTTGGTRNYSKCVVNYENYTLASSFKLLCEYFRLLLEYFMGHTGTHFSPDHAPKNKLSIIAIIGVGGIGKTTLAQIVRKELMDSKYFDCVVWVHVSSNTFDATRITKKILEAIIKEKPNADTLEVLQYNLKEELKAKKFLIILDDVWEDNKTDEWEKLLAPLRTSVRGSRILLTTRMRSVADMVTHVTKGPKEILNLDGLHDDHNFTLFRKYAFDDVQASNYVHLLPMARELAKKFRGCPLLAKIAGGHLKSNLSDRYWNDLDTQLDHLEGRMDDIITTVLRSSYHLLPANLQLCFRYCSIFPQDYEFKKEELVRMWMASGLIEEDTRDKRPEDTGEFYLMQLARKSFFTFVPKEDPCSQDCMGYYTIHDLLHDLARTVSLGECLRFEPSGHKYDMPTVRHLWIANFSKLTIEDIKALSNSKHLRTLVIEDSRDVSKDYRAPLEKAVENLKCLRLLSLNGITKFHFASKASNKHLRYLHFSGMQEVYGFSKLYHLQVLTVSNSICADPKELKGLGRISSLRYVSYGAKALGEFPVGDLHSLQELQNLQIQSKKGYGIGSLSNLSSLRELKVSCLENVGTPEEVEEAKLSEKHHLKSLSMSWSEPNIARRSEDKSIIDKLEPPGKLKKLEVTGYGGAELPTWMKCVSLTNLVSLELRRCIYWQHLPDLGNLQLLKHLELEKLSELRRIGQSSDSLPPYITSLVVKDCENLSILPVLPSSLVQLKIDAVGLISLPTISDPHDSNVGLEATSPRLLSVIIRCCPRLESLEGSFLLQERYARSFRILNIVDCEKLKSAPLLFGKMNDLTGFHIGKSYCIKMMEKVDGGLLPNTLKELSINWCGELQRPLLDSLLGLSNLTSLKIYHCSMEALPSSGVFKSLTALRIMAVERCGSLTCLGGLGALSHLTWLQITDCEKLAKSGDAGGGMLSEFSLQVYLLWVDFPSVLDMQPLSRLRDTKSLIISACPYNNRSISRQWLELNRKSLESLEIDKPGSVQSLEDFCSLKRLDFHRANEYTALPALPTSLECFIVRVCDEKLEESWGRKGSSEWDKISHIPHVRIGRTYYKSGQRSKSF